MHKELILRWYKNLNENLESRFWINKWWIRQVLLFELIKLLQILRILNEQLKIRSMLGALVFCFESRAYFGNFRSLEQIDDTALTCSSREQHISTQTMSCLDNSGVAPWGLSSPWSYIHLWLTCLMRNVYYQNLQNLVIAQGAHTYHQFSQCRRSKENLWPIFVSGHQTYFRVRPTVCHFLPTRTHRYISFPHCVMQAHRCIVISFLQAFTVGKVVNWGSSVYVSSGLQKRGGTNAGKEN